MSKFKQLLALATRLLEMEETATVLRSELLTLQDSHDRIGADMAEAIRIAGEKNKQVESLEQKLKSVELRVSTPPDRFVKADSLVQSLGYTFRGGFWTKPAPPAAIPPVMPAAPAAIPPTECSPPLPKIRNEDCKQDPFTDGDVEPSTYRGGLKNRCKKCDMVGHFTKNCPRDEKAGDQ